MRRDVARSFAAAADFGSAGQGVDLSIIGQVVSTSILALGAWTLLSDSSAGGPEVRVLGLPQSTHASKCTGRWAGPGDGSGGRGWHMQTQCMPACTGYANHTHAHATRTPKTNPAPSPPPPPRPSRREAASRALSARGQGTRSACAGGGQTATWAARHAPRLATWRVGRAVAGAPPCRSWQRSASTTGGVTHAREPHAASARCCEIGLHLQDLAVAPLPAH